MSYAWAWMIRLTCWRLLKSIEDPAEILATLMILASWGSESINKDVKRNGAATLTCTILGKFGAFGSLYIGKLNGTELRISMLEKLGERVGEEARQERKAKEGEVCRTPQEARHTRHENR